jgi:hypothetical protein
VVFPEIRKTDVPLGQLRKERGLWDDGWSEAKNIADKKGPAAFPEEVVGY